MKRSGYLSWNDYFMAVAQLSAQRSKDPNTQVGACIVDTKNRIIGVGYNGFPYGCSDDELPWEKVGDFLDTKYPYVCHAEKNAILNASNKRELDGSALYVTLFPCNVCAQDIIQAGIKEVYYLDNKYHDRDFSIAARRLLDLAGIKYEQYVPTCDMIEIWMKVK
jgi:dCMP deaminase